MNLFSSGCGRGLRAALAALQAFGAAALLAQGVVPAAAPPSNATPVSIQVDLGKQLGAYKQILSLIHI